MSITRQVTVCCDYCNTWEQATATVGELRKKLKASGWTHSRGQDFCRACSLVPPSKAEPAPPAKTED